MCDENKNHKCEFLEFLELEDCIQKYVLDEEFLELEEYVLDEEEIPIAAAVTLQRVYRKAL